MRLRKDAWFRAVVSELRARGFERGGMACPNIVSSYCRNGTTIEVRGGRTLRVIRRSYEVGYPNLDLTAAIEIIDQATRNAG